MAFFVAKKAQNQHEPTKLLIRMSEADACRTCTYLLESGGVCFLSSQFHISHPAKETTQDLPKDREASGSDQYRAVAEYSFLMKSAKEISNTPTEREICR